MFGQCVAPCGGALAARGWARWPCAGNWGMICCNPPPKEEGICCVGGGDLLVVLGGWGLGLAGVLFGGLGLWGGVGFDF